MKSKKYSFAYIMMRIMPMQFKSIPWLTTLCIILGIIHGLTWTIGVIATQGLFDAISDAAVGNLDLWGCVAALLFLSGATFGQQIMNGMHNFVFDISLSKSGGKVRTILHNKIQRIEPVKFEDPVFLDDLNKAGQSVHGEFPVIPFFCFSIYSLITLYGAYFISLGVYLFQLKPMLLITLLISFIPALLSQVVRAKVFTKLEDESAPLRRKYEYYQRALCDREYFKETRILGTFNYFHNLFVDTMQLLTFKTWKAERKTAILELTLNIASFVGMTISSYMLFVATMAGEISIGAFAAVFQALGLIFAVMQEVFSFYLGTLNKDVGKVANFVRVLDMPERIGKCETPDFSKGIVAENISFTYPGRDAAAINNVSLTIADGETIAIVGDNGAGKSTLVRLLTGIYHPTEGKVIIGGNDSKAIAPEFAFKGISGVFQKYQRYKMTLMDNVSISDSENEIDTSRIESALKESDAKFDREVRLDSMLSPEFEGIDLSGGQWQRLAIARGLYRVNQFIVLDEPTSAIDPVEETKIYNKFQQLSIGKCAVIVTHRLGSAKLAHRIVVMHNGKIDAIGTHEELMSIHGKYANMWEAQVQWYERDDNTVSKSRSCC